MTAKPTPIPDTEPAPPIVTKWDVRIPVQVQPASPSPARGWKLHHLIFRGVEAKSENEAVDLVMRQIRNVQVVLPDYLKEGASLESFDDFAAEEEPLVP